MIICIFTKLKHKKFSFYTAITCPPPCTLMSGGAHKVLALICVKHYRNNFIDPRTKEKHHDSARANVTVCWTRRRVHEVSQAFRMSMTQHMVHRGSSGQCIRREQERLVWGHSRNMRVEKRCNRTDARLGGQWRFYGGVMHIY